MSSRLRLSLSLVGLVLFNWAVSASGTDLADYRTVDKAVAAKIAKSDATVVAVRPFLGVEVALDGQGRLTVSEVALDSPAARAGVQRGDRLVNVDGKSVK